MTSIKVIFSSTLICSNKYDSNTGLHLASDFSSSPLNDNDFVYYLGESLQESFSFESVTESAVHETFYQ